METNISNFVEQWREWTLQGSYVFLGIAILLTLGYFLRLLFVSGKSNKYDYINKYETRLLWYSLLSITIAIGLLLNYGIESFFTTGNLFEFVIAIFMSGIISTIFGYTAYAYIKYYYPSIIEKKLTKLRFTPRISPESGKQMKLLTELEEDEHLTQEMIADEEGFVYEYDVWIDEETGHKFIEKYDAHLHALLCTNCNFRTLKEYKETIVKSPTDNEEGMLTKFYKCSYCGHSERKEGEIAALSSVAV